MLLVIIYLYVVGTLTIFLMARKLYQTSTLSMVIRAAFWPLWFPLMNVLAIAMAI